MARKLTSDQSTDGILAPGERPAPPPVFTDSLAQSVAQVPGGLLVGLTAVPRALTEGVAEVVRAVGQATGNTGLQEVGGKLIDSQEAVVRAELADPVASVQVVAGATLVATGVGTSAGLALASKGVAQIAADASGQVPQPGAQAVSPLAAPLPRIVTDPSTTPGAAAASLWARLLEWFRRLFHREA